MSTIPQPVSWTVRGNVQNTFAGQLRCLVTGKTLSGMTPVLTGLVDDVDSANRLLAFFADRALFLDQQRQLTARVIVAVQPQYLRVLEILRQMIVHESYQLSPLMVLRAIRRFDYEAELPSNKTMKLFIQQLREERDHKKQSTLETQFAMEGRQTCQTVSPQPLSLVPLPRPTPRCQSLTQ